MGTTNVMGGIDRETNQEVWPHRYQVSNCDEESPNSSVTATDTGDSKKKEFNVFLRTAITNVEATGGCHPPTDHFHSSSRDLGGSLERGRER